MNFKKIRALLIDIDDTITCFKPHVDEADIPGHKTASLFDVLQSAGVELGRLTPEETAARIDKVKNTIRWWHWSDYIVELGLNPKTFWDYAYKKESAYLEATGSEIRGALERLQGAGILLYVASNNPSSGILHKLCLAGLAHMNGSKLFNQLLGATELQAMKWEPLYWRKAMAHTALDGNEIAVVGDNLRDDYEIPLSVGIAGTFLINRFEDLSRQDTDTLIHVQNFDQIAGHILMARACPAAGQGGLPMNGARGIIAETE